MSLCDFALRAYVYIYLVGGVSTYKHVVQTCVCVWVTCAVPQGAQFSIYWCGCVLCALMYVYIVCTHMSTRCNDVLL